MRVTANIRSSDGLLILAHVKNGLLGCFCPDAGKCSSGLAVSGQIQLLGLTGLREFLGANAFVQHNCHVWESEPFLMAAPTVM